METQHLPKTLFLVNLGKVLDEMTRGRLPYAQSKKWWESIEVELVSGIDEDGRRRIIRQFIEGFNSLLSRDEGTDGVDT